MIWHYEDYSGLENEKIPVAEFFAFNPIKGTKLIGPYSGILDTGSDVTVFPQGLVDSNLFKDAPEGEEIRVNDEIVKPKIIDIYLLFHEFNKNIFEELLKVSETEGKELLLSLFSYREISERYVLNTDTSESQKAELVAFLETLDFPLNTLRQSVSVIFSKRFDEFIIGRNLLNIDKMTFHGPMTFTEYL